MSIFGKTDASCELLNVISEERLALINADFSKIESITNKKEALIRRIAKNPTITSKVDIKKIEQATNEIFKLYQAIQEGLRSASERLKNLNTPAQPFATYRARGEKTINRQTSLERKF